jgi:hypothetical protein
MLPFAHFYLTIEVLAKIFGHESLAVAIYFLIFIFLVSSLVFACPSNYAEGR